jgi:hypothetical protein
MGSKTIRWRTGKTKGVSWGEISIPDNLGHVIQVRATANEPRKALARAATIAEKSLTDKALDQLGNPVLQSLLPPGAGPAIQTAAKMLRSKAAREIYGGARSGLRAIRSLF